MEIESLPLSGSLQYAQIQSIAAVGGRPVSIVIEAYALSNPGESISAGMPDICQRFTYQRLNTSREEKSLQRAGSRRSLRSVLAFLLSDPGITIPLLGTETQAQSERVCFRADQPSL